MKIIGTGKALPKRLVHSIEIDELLNKEHGWTQKTSGVIQRYFLDPDSESVSTLGAQAAVQALENAGLEANDVDLILSACGTQKQILPGTAVFIQKELGLGDSGKPAFDINATCLSFLVAIDVASMYLESGKYKNILIISADIASVGINHEHPESFSLLGDAAAAIIVNNAGESDNSSLHGFKLSTYGDYSSLCQIRGGGTDLYPTKFDKSNPQPFLFEMDGMNSYKFVSQHLSCFVDSLLSESKQDISSIQHIIPHQASKLGMALVKRQLSIKDDRLVSTLEKYGNTISASIPITLHDAICSGHIRRDDKCLLIGTAAGMSLGGAVITY
ncbi:3-oxoacyl-ACP synthase [Veronia nyctiphanis]|uniref:3-oxoacyl-ACP synthase n=1 Tax=Veronia nyctiphanis TaxID=1278244 RepID=A0A4Q0YMZ7_9GAMM|nr:3-oxoacyl-[acyl-carrier-protein] synthase III C-terminal domain-containing protein [Veronia nyctiphanis]RXJ71755.1 3-oxoacyl-ACP synthase [Veronia nyctiphanis]